MEKEKKQKKDGLLLETQDQDDDKTTHECVMESGGGTCDPSGGPKTGSYTVMGD